MTPRTDPDAVFWDRLADMPFDEQEQECVLRREHVTLQLAVLRGAKAKAEDDGRVSEARRLGVAIFEDCAQLTALNERIKYLRRQLDGISWRNGVRAVLGEDAYLQVVEWRRREESERMALGYPSRST